ncbi:MULTISPECIES: hypothetical protein [Methylobacterium]|uniref:hypothetical protein n=1 Tax=Methylobacterium TaxID=407 RepID=UPI0013EE21E8|nr:hypothetical protein [Methylobacterium sp. DB0501]NGM34423.1 hypothetical protein [Methylobacterium sp. DB0501]
MLIARDLYTHFVTQPIVSSQTTLGETIIQYEVRAYNDVRNLGTAKSYLITCTQRLVLPNPAAYNPAAGATTSFLNYPAILKNSIDLLDPNKQISTVNIVEYSPRTLNTTVNTSQNIAQSQNSSTSRQSTTGSSTAQTNSYGFSASLGFFGDAPVGDVSSNAQFSTTNEQSSSLSTGSAVDHGSQLSNSSSMAIKDWGSYASINTATQSPTWVWGQEYPWNVMQFKGTDANANIVLPAFVAARLYDGSVVYPPSELSNFGLDFVARASWLVTPVKGHGDAIGPVFKHTLIYGAASHKVSGGQLTADLTTYQPILYTSDPLDLPLLALDPIQAPGAGPAVLGFIAPQFDVAPTSTGAAFAITADSNDLLVRGQGFNGVLSTDFSTGPVEMTVSFKVVDPSRTVTLSLRHWITAGTPIQLSLVVNGDTAMPLTRFVDAQEMGSGGDNVSAITLRNKDFSSNDYCDYLQMGLNTVTITATPVGGQSKAGYQIMAMAVG